MLVFIKHFTFSLFVSVIKVKEVGLPVDSRGIEAIKCYEVSLISLVQCNIFVTNNFIFSRKLNLKVWRRVEIME